MSFELAWVQMSNCITVRRLTFPLVDLRHLMYPWPYFVLHFFFSAPHFQGVSLFRLSSLMCKYAKKTCPGWEIAGFSEATKRERQGDTLTCKHNLSMTVEISWPQHWSGLHHWLLLIAIWTARGIREPGGQESYLKFSGDFVHIYPPKMSNFYPLASLSSCLPFEHCSTSLEVAPLHSTLCPSIISICSTSKFHLNTLQYSDGGDVMLNAITYGKDCISIYTHLKREVWMDVCDCEFVCHEVGAPTIAPIGTELGQQTLA